MGRAPDLCWQGSPVARATRKACLRRMVLECTDVGCQEGVLAQNGAGMYMRGCLLGGHRRAHAIMACFVYRVGS